jgi:hypothetical protein
LILIFKKAYVTIIKSGHLSSIVVNDSSRGKGKGKGKRQPSKIPDKNTSEMMDKKKINEAII